MAEISAEEAGGQNVVAFLDMLAWSEGTDHPKQKSNDRGYDVIVGGELFNSYRDHPRRVVTLPRLGIKSTAAGRYQLLARFWPHYRDLLELDDFGPYSQDLVAIQLIRERRAIGDVKAGRIVPAIEKCRNIWASLPGAGYGQHEHKLEALLAEYKRAGGVLV
ncbi:MAG: glycoside hydrolase family 104 protein [Pseudomonadota bacterium]